MVWLKGVLSHFGEPSTKRHVVFIAAVSLCAVFIVVGLACAWWIYGHGELGTGAVAALSIVAGVTAGLAGHAYRKADGVAAPSAPGVTTTADVGCVGTPTNTGSDGSDRGAL